MKVFHSSIHRECMFMQLNSLNFKVFLATFKHTMYFWEKTLRESREGGRPVSSSLFIFYQGSYTLSQRYFQDFSTTFKDHINKNQGPLK